MSLNGLDNAQVKEAHEAAVAEAGGWYVYSFYHRQVGRAISSLAVLAC